MEWQLFWMASGVVVTLAATILGCFKSLSADIRTMDQRLSKLEGMFEERGRWESHKKG